VRAFPSFITGCADLRGAAGAYLEEGGTRGKHGFPREARPEAEAPHGFPREARPEAEAEAEA
jgi:hypothetical protein